MPNKKLSPQVKRLWEILNAQDQGNLTKAEATDIGFTYLIESGFTPSNDNLSLPEIYIRMVSVNMDTLQWSRLTKADLALKVAEAIGCESVELNNIDEDGLSSDYAFICGIFENWGYIDLYYLIPPIDSEVLLITGMTVSDE